MIFQKLRMKASQLLNRKCGKLMEFSSQPTDQTLGHLGNKSRLFIAHFWIPGNKLNYCCLNSAMNVADSPPCGKASSPIYQPPACSFITKTALRYILDRNKIMTPFRQQLQKHSTSEQVKKETYKHCGCESSKWLELWLVHLDKR